MTQNDSSIEFEQKLQIFINKLIEKSRNQFNWDLKSNVPSGRVKLEECAEHSLNQGIVSAFNEVYGWDCDKAIRAAYSIMEDANCHTEAKELVKFIPEYQ